MVPAFCLKRSNFEIQFFQIVQMALDGKMTKTKVIDLDEIYNFVVDNYFVMRPQAARDTSGSL